MSGELVAFIILSAGLLSSGAGVLIARNPIYSALSLIMSFFFLAGLYLQLNATFVAIIQILVYGGAIMVLFVFVIMLLNLSDDELGERRWNLHKVVGGLSVLLILGVLVSAIAGAQKGYLSEPAVMRTAVLQRLDSAGQRHFPAARQLVLDVNRLGELASSSVLDPATKAEAASVLARLGRVPDESQGAEDASGAPSEMGLKQELPAAVTRRLSSVIAKTRGGDGQAASGERLTRGDLSVALRTLLDGIMSGDVESRRSQHIDAIMRLVGTSKEDADEGTRRALVKAVNEVSPLLRQRASSVLSGLLEGGLDASELTVVSGLLEQERRFWSGVAFYRDLTELVSWGEVRMRADKGTEAAGVAACRISGRLLSRDLVELGVKMRARPALAELGRALKLGEQAQVRWVQLAEAAEKLRKRLPKVAKHSNAITELRQIAAYPTLEASQQTRAAELIKANADLLQSQIRASDFTASASLSKASFGMMVLRASLDEEDFRRQAEAFKGAFDENSSPRAQARFKQQLNDRNTGLPSVPTRSKAFFEEPDATVLTPEGLLEIAGLLEQAVAGEAAFALDAVEIELLHELSARVSPPESRALVDLELPVTLLERMSKEADIYADCLEVTPTDQKQLTRVASHQLRGYDHKLTALAAVVESHRGPAAWRGHGAERLVPIELTRVERAALEPVDAVYGARLLELVEEASEQVFSLDEREALAEQVEIKLASRGNPVTRYQMGLMRLDALRDEGTGLGATDALKSRTELVLASYEERIEAVKSDYETAASSVIASVRERGPSAEAMMYRPAVFDEDEYGTVKTVGRDLFTTYLLPFEVTSVLLLAGILGAVVIARRRV